jgi:hypothetical protein
VLVTLLALGFVGIAIALSVRIELTAFQFVGGLINFPVFFLSGAFYPVESLPDWLRSVVLVNPMTYAVDGLRGVMIKGESLLNVIPDVVIVGIFALLTQLLGNLALYLALSGKHIRIRHRSEKKPTVENQRDQEPAIEKSGDQEPVVNPEEAHSSTDTRNQATEETAKKEGIEDHTP